MGAELITRPGPWAVPFSYVLGATETLRPTTAFAHFDGTGASGSFLACLTFYAPTGEVITRVFPSTTIAAGGVADVSYAPFPGGLSATSAAGGGTRTITVRLETPDSTGNGYPALTTNNGFANDRRVLPAFTKSADGTWQGSVEVPADYASGGTVTLTWAANATTGNLRNRVGSSVAATGATLDAAYTQEAYASTAAAGTALRRFQSSFALSTTLAAGSTLNVQVGRNGTNVADTLAVDALLFGCDLSYVSSY